MLSFKTISKGLGFETVIEFLQVFSNGINAEGAEGMSASTILESNLECTRTGLFAHTGTDLSLCV